MWLIFLQTHFGKHISDEWKLMRNVYGSFGGGRVWTLAEYSRDAEAFRVMLDENADKLSDPRVSGRYSNHRQYQSKKPAHIAQVLATFSGLISAAGGFRGLINQVHQDRGQNPVDAFDGLYNELSQVAGFGRLAKFDFLTMLSKLQLAPISPGTTYLPGATGPLMGANLLVHGNREYGGATRSLIARIDALDRFLHVGKQVIEDSLCNWQKHPTEYRYFRG